jgi:transposase-like protein
MVFDHADKHPSQWAAITSIAGKIGCSPQTLHAWVARAERDRGLRAGPTTEERERIKALEREIRELRQANEILRKASAYFARGESSTADGSHDQLCRCAPQPTRGRVGDALR